MEDAVEDIVYREVGEVQKKAFGDDSDDAKNLPWSREQAWSLFKQLAKKAEVSDHTQMLSPYSMNTAKLPYHEVLLEFPFKGDEAPLRNMEHAELIAIGTHNGILIFGFQRVSLIDVG